MDCGVISQALVLRVLDRLGAIALSVILQHSLRMDRLYPITSVLLLSSWWLLGWVEKQVLTVSLAIDVGEEKKTGVG